MPYLSKYNRYFFWLGVTWWFAIPFLCPLATTYVGNWGLAAKSLGPFYLVVDLFLLILIAFHVSPKPGPRSFGTNPFFLHLTFTIWTSLYVGNMRFFQIIPSPPPPGMARPHFEWAMVLAAIATVLYLMAYIKGHNVVYSRTLGGPGIEPLSLTLRSSEPLYNTIMDEGRIQLT